MMSVHRDWRRRFPALTYPAISAETAAPYLAATSSPLYSSCCATSRGSCLASFEGGRRSGFARVVGFAEQISFAA